MLCYTLDMVNLTIHEHAYKHSLSYEEIVSAFMNQTVYKRQGNECESRYLSIGFAFNGKQVELVYIEEGIYDFLIIHAMSPATKKTINILNQKGEGYDF